MSRKRSSITAPTVDSDGVKPAVPRWSSRIRAGELLRRPAIWPSSGRSVVRPSTGVRSSLKSPVCRIVPAGVRYAVAKLCGTECDTGMNWHRTGRSFGVTVVRPGSARYGREPGSSIRLRAKPATGPSRRSGPTLTQQVRQAPAWSSWRVREDDPFDPIGVLAQVREIGKHEVDAGHVGVGEHQPAVDDQDPPVDLEQKQLRPISPRPPRNTMRTRSIDPHEDGVPPAARPPGTREHYMLQALPGD